MRVCHCTLHLTNPKACETCNINNPVPSITIYPTPNDDGQGTKPFPTYPLSLPAEKKEGWVCPKCGRVYANWVWECKACNDKITENEK